jgi:glycosyltransferase 2 family protein
MGAKSRKWLLLLAVALVLGYLLFRSRHIFDFGDFSGAKLWETIRGANLTYLLVAVFLIYICYFIRSLRWQNFQKRVGPAPLGSIYAMTLAGFAGIVLLGRAGEPVRPLLLSRKNRIPLADTFGIYALERLLDTAAAAVLAAAGLIIFTARRQSHPGATSATFETAAKTGATFLCVGVVVAILVLIYLRLHGSAILERRLQTWITAHGWRASIARILLGLVHGVQAIRTWTDLLVAIFYSAIHWLLVAVVYYLIPLAFAGQLAQLTFQDAIIVLVFTLVGSVVQLPGVGGGSQALAILAYTSVFGIEKEPAVAVAMVIWLVTFASCSIAGVPILIKEGLSLGELRSMRAHESEELDAEMSAKDPV